MKLKLTILTILTTILAATFASITTAAAADPNDPIQLAFATFKEEKAKTETDIALVAAVEALKGAKFSIATSDIPIVTRRLASHGYHVIGNHTADEIAELTVGVKAATDAAITAIQGQPVAGNVVDHIHYLLPVLGNAYRDAVLGKPNAKKATSYYVVAVGALAGKLQKIGTAPVTVAPQPSVPSASPNPPQATVAVQIMPPPIVPSPSATPSPAPAVAPVATATPAPVVKKSIPRPAGAK
jgi:hypothetical protein